MKESSLRHLRIEDFNYELPEDRIALYPLSERDASKMLVYHFPAQGKKDAGSTLENRIQTARFRDIGKYLPEKSLLVFNNTRVVRARLIFSKKTTAGSIPGQNPARIEIFCLEPTQPADIAQAFAASSPCRFKCLIGNNKKWKEGEVLLRFPLPASQDLLPDSQECSSQHREGENIGEGVLEARKVAVLEDAFEVEFSWSPAHLSFSEVLELAGKVPLPPYLHRQAEESDTERYQTVFALHDGSVAAPTAGLHFTPSVIESLQEEGIGRAFVTLHVGAGTFKPVKAEEIGAHTMHQEHISVERESIVQLLEAIEGNRPVIPVGTTSMRSLESVYWMGVKLHLHPETDPSHLVVNQWDPYEDLCNERIPPAQSLRDILSYMDTHQLTSLEGITSLMIAPGYRFAFCRGIITNFHQPQSTLLLLVSAMIGQDWKKIYDFALKNGFRFLSYGDCCLFLEDVSN